MSNGIFVQATVLKPGYFGGYPAVTFPILLNLPLLGGYRNLSGHHVMCATMTISSNLTNCFLNFHDLACRWHWIWFIFWLQSCCRLLMNLQGGYPDTASDYIFWICSSVCLFICCFQIYKGRPLGLSSGSV